MVLSERVSKYIKIPLINFNLRDRSLFIAWGERGGGGGGGGGGSYVFLKDEEGGSAVIDRH